MSMRFSSYLALSALSMVMMIYYAYYTRRQFYPAVLFLVTCKTSFVIAANLAIAFALAIARFVKTMYFGNLRDAEVELLIEKAKYAIVETSLALTIFRNELSVFTSSLFGTLILIKLLHKLTKCRVEYLEQIMPISSAVQLRMGFLLCTLLVVDVLGVAYAAQDVMQKGKTVLILFGFEFGLLFVYAFNISIRFVIQLVDNYMPSGLQSRGLLTMIADLVCDVIKAVAYVSFFVLILLNYGLPVHLLRDLWATIHSLKRKFFGFIKYLQLNKNLDNRFPDASPEEIANAGSCLVCREDIERGKKLPCGHVFHLDCLRMWLQHQQTCPLCRADIPTSAPVPEVAPVVLEAAPQVAPEPPQQAVVAAPPSEVDAHTQRDDAPPGTIDLPVAAGQPPTPPPEPVTISPVTRPVGVPRPRRTSPRSNPSAPVRHEKASVQQFGTSAASSPVIYIVLVDSVVFVHRDPTHASPALRNLKKGSLLFVELVVQGGDSAWLKIPDGWVPSSLPSLASESGRATVVVPFVKERLTEPAPTAKPSSTPSSSRGHVPIGSSLSQAGASPSAFSSFGDRSCTPVIPASSRTSPVPRHEHVRLEDGSKERRLGELVALQAQLRALTQQMTQMNEAILQCQAKICQLTRDELEQREHEAAAKLSTMQMGGESVKEA